MNETITLWEPTPMEVIPPGATTATEMTTYAIQLSAKDRNQIAQALEMGHYEMGVNHLWIRSMTALKRELSTLGADFLGEMLGRPEIDGDSNPLDFLSDKEALQLAEELGILSSTEAIRLRQTQEMVIHFAQKDRISDEYDEDEMDQLEALRALKTCIKNILGKPKIEVAQRFVVFREQLLTAALVEASATVDMLRSSPYFFRRLAVNILISASKTAVGASLEKVLSNLNTVLPALWKALREVEKLQVGRAYSEVYASGQSVATQGIKKALLKVKGFDYVPENLRSDSFVKAADEILAAHDGWDNFFAEEAPVRILSQMGDIIPAHAIEKCTTALLAVILGNYYGISRAAAPIAHEMLSRFSIDRWNYYLNQCLPSDSRTLNSIQSARPKRNWIALVEKYELQKCEIKNKNVRKLLDASTISAGGAPEVVAARLLAEYYGRK